MASGATAVLPAFGPGDALQRRPGEHEAFGECRAALGGCVGVARRGPVSGAEREAELRAHAMWRVTEERLREFAQKQARATRLLETELRSCQEKNHLLEEEKALLVQAIEGLQERMAAAEAVLRLRALCGAPGQPAWPGQAPADAAASPWGSPAVGRAANEALAGEKYPPLPDFPLLEETAEEAEEGRGRAPLAVEPPAQLAAAGAPPRSGPAEAVAKISLAELVGPRPGQAQPPAAHCAPRPGPAAGPGPSAALRSATPRRSPTTSHGLLTPPRTPQRSSKARLGNSTPMKSPVVPSSPFVLLEDGGCMFGFTLRLADGVDLGLELTPCADGEDGGGLRVETVRPGGAIDSWNRQCVGGPSAGKAVAAGDRIVAVNGLREPQAMLQESRQKLLLRFNVVRAEPDGDPSGRFQAPDRASDLCGKLPVPTPMPGLPSTCVAAQGVVLGGGSTASA